MRLLAATLLATWAVGSTAIAQDVANRLSLPLDGRALDLAPYAEGDGPTRIVLTGTLSSRIDGSEIDAFSRWLGDVRDDATGPFVVLPPGARVAQAEPQTHRYVVEIPHGQSMRVALHTAPLAARQLVTASELRASLFGAIEAEVLAPPPGPVHAATSQAQKVATGLPWAALGGTAASVPILALIALWLVRRREGRVDDRLLRRAKRAADVIAAEAAGAGPAFGPIVSESRRVLDSAVEVQTHYRAGLAAEARIRRLPSSGAAQRREEIRAQQEEALCRLRRIADRLEETAAHIACHGAGQVRPTNVEGMLHGLTAEIDTVISADGEAAAAAELG